MKMMKPYDFGEAALELMSANTTKPSLSWLKWPAASKLKQLASKFDENTEFVTDCRQMS